MPPLHKAVVKKYTLKSWDSWTGEETQVEELSHRSDEYRRVAAAVHQDLNVPIDCIERIQNHFLWGMFLLKKAEYKTKFHGSVQEDLFHCTSVQNIESIIEDNLDWRRARRTKFGQGVSFSPSASYANLQANKNIGISRALILAKVLVGYQCAGRQDMTVPPPGFDTSIGNGRDVVVKYCDNEFYPQYVIYYDTPPIRYTPPRRYVYHQ